MNTGFFRERCKPLILALAVVSCWTFRTTAWAQTHTVLKHFGATPSAYYPQAGLTLSGGVLYGTTSSGGSAGGSGAVFKLNTDGSGYTEIKGFSGGSDGSSLEGGVTLSGGVLYGTTRLGGSYSKGTVFKVNTDGTGFAVLKHFYFGVGSWPKAGLALSGSALYGTTTDEDGSGVGSVFKLNTDGSGYAQIKSLSSGDGKFPYAGLTLSGGVLYGTATAGGINGPGYGTVFKMGTDGSGFAVLKHFSSTDGRTPQAVLVAAGGVLYGTTKFGGSSDYGTVFKVNTDGTGFTVLRHFAGGADERYPVAGLALSGSVLYGTTYFGGTSNKGTVFKINTDGSGYSVLKHFGGSDGANPQGELAVSGGVLYGTTYRGGDSDAGTVFSLSLGTAPAITAQPASRTVTAGSAATFTVTATGDAPLSYQWRKNGSNIAGAASASYTISAAAASDAGDYSVVVTNPYGSITSSVATLTVSGAPANDNFASRITIPSAGGSVTGNNTGATKETGEPNHNSAGGASVWWTWTAPVSGLAVVDTIGSSYDTLLGIYTGASVAGLTTIGTNDDVDGGRQSRVTFNATAGTAYQIAVDGYQNAQGFITLNVSLTPAPVITVQPVSQTLPLGGTLALSVTASNAAAYQWRKDGANLTTGGRVTGATANGLTITGLTVADSGAYTVVVTNAGGSVTSAVATVTVLANNPPVAQAQSVTTAEDTPKAITLSGTDADGNPLTYVVVSGPTNGVLTGTGANRTYTPNTNFNGGDSFTFKVNDGTVDSALATVSITVVPVNDAPVALPQSVTTPAGTSKAITLAGTDVEGSLLSYLVVVQPANGTLTGTGASRTYTPKAGFTGSDSFRFKAQDGSADSAPATVSITVTPVNLPPVLQPIENRPLPVGTTDAQMLTVSDPDDNVTNLTFTVTSSITNVVPEVDSYDFFGVPFVTVRVSAPNWTGGRADITVTVRDPAGATDSKTFSVFRGTVGFTLPSLPDPAGKQWKIPPSLDNPRRWAGVACSADGSIRMGVVDGGRIYINTNSSTQFGYFGYWRDVGPQLAWRDIACSADGTKIVAVGERTNIFTSTDAGATWVPRAVATNWISVASSSDGTKLVAVAERIYTSADSGQTWTPQALKGYFASVASSADGNRLVAASRGGAVYTSTDAGRNWVQRGIRGYWTDVASSADGLNLVVVGDGGLRTDENSQVMFEDNWSNAIFTSTDGGATWTQRERGYWYSVACSADGVELLVSGRSGQRLSQDSGLSWRGVSELTTTGSRSVVASSTNGSVLLMAAYRRDKYVDDYRYSRFYPAEGRLVESRDGTQPVKLQAYTGVPFVRSNFATITVPPDNASFQVSIGERNGGNTLAFSVPPAISRDGTLTFTLAPPSVPRVETREATFTAWLNTDYGSPPSQDFIIASTTAMAPRGLSVSGGATISGTGGDLGVSFSGTPLVSYQWLRNGTPIPGATSERLPIAGLARDTSQYSVIVSNAYGASTSSWIYAYAPSNMVVGTVAYVGGVQQAKIFMDVNKNGVYDSGEPYAFSDAQGRFSLPVATNGTTTAGLARAAAGLAPAGISFANTLIPLIALGGYNSALGGVNTLTMRIGVPSSQLASGSLPSISVSPYSSLVSSVASASFSLTQSLTNSITNDTLQAALSLNQSIGTAMTTINRALGYSPPAISGTGNILFPDANPLPGLSRSATTDLISALSIPNTTLINAKIGSMSALTKSVIGVNLTSSTNTNTLVAAGRLMTQSRTAALQPAGGTNTPPSSAQVDDAFIATLTARIASGAEVNLNDPAQLTSLLGDTLAQLPPTGLTPEQIQGAATIVARINQLTDEAAASGESPAEMVTKFLQMQVAAQGPVAQQLAAVGAGTLSIEDALANTTPETLRELAAQAVVGDLFGDETRVGIFEFSADSYSVNEDGSTTLPVTVNRSQGDNGAVSVVVSLTPGTAMLGADYTTNTVTLDFAPGELRKTLNLPSLVVDDAVLEEPETVSLSLSLAPGAPVGALLGERTNATLTILDNDWAGEFAFSQAGFSVNEDGTAFSPVLIRRTGGAVGTVNLIVTTLARTNGAVPGVDYINTNILVTFGPGERSKRVRVPVINNLIVGDGTRALDLGLSFGPRSEPDAVLGGSDRAQLLILDDDTPQSVWRTQNFGSPLDRGNGADAAAPDGDGIPNLVKYALNLPPGTPGQSGLPRAYFAIGQPEQQLSLDIPFHPARTDVVIEVLAADTVAGPWTVIASIGNGIVLTDTGVVSVADGAGGAKVAIVRDLVNSLAARHRFLSVRVRR